MEEYQSTHVPMRSKTMALGTAGDVDTADIVANNLLHVTRAGIIDPEEIAMARSRDEVGHILSRFLRLE